MICARYAEVMQLKHAFILKWGMRQLEIDYNQVKERLDDQRKYRVSKGTD